MKRAIATTFVILCHGFVWADDRQSLQGSWLAVAAEREGKSADDVRGHVVRFSGDGFSIRLKDKELYNGTFKLYPETKPHGIDFLHTGGTLAGKTWKGIYVLEKDRLRICDNAPNLEAPRPTSFVTRPDSGLVSVLLRRQE